jgi:hypothetical protein
MKRTAYLLNNCINVANFAKNVIKQKINKVEILFGLPFEN